MFNAIIWSRREFRSAAKASSEHGAAVYDSQMHCVATLPASFPTRPVPAVTTVSPIKPRPVTLPR